MRSEVIFCGHRDRNGGARGNINVRVRPCCKQDPGEYSETSLRYLGVLDMMQLMGRGGGGVVGW